MAGQGYSYLTDELHAHRQHLGGVSSILAEAGGAVRSMGVPPNAFGLIGSFIPALLQPMVDEAALVIDAGAESIDQTANIMGSTLETYYSADSQGQNGFTRLEGVL